MKIGILSDTHDNLPNIEKAVRLFNKDKVGFVFHAGDFVAPFVLSKIKALNSDWRGVFGNNDGEKEGLMRASEKRIKEGPLRMTLDNKKIVLVHDLNKIDAKKEDADLIIFGHTHKAEVLKQDNKLLINPGECGGWLTGAASVGIVDLSSLSSEIIKI